MWLLFLNGGCFLLVLRDWFVKSQVEQIRYFSMKALEINRMQNFLLASNYVWWSLNRFSLTKLNCQPKGSWDIDWIIYILCDFRFSLQPMQFCHDLKLDWLFVIAFNRLWFVDAWSTTTEFYIMFYSISGIAIWIGCHRMQISTIKKCLYRKSCFCCFCFYVKTNIQLDSWMNKLL